MFRTNSSSAPTQDQVERHVEPSRPPRSIPLPRKVLYEEGQTVLSLLRRHWRPLVAPDGALVHRGFSSLGEAHLPHSTAQDLEALLTCLRDEDRSATVLDRAELAQRTKRAKRLVSELRGVARAVYARCSDPTKTKAVRDLDAAHGKARTGVELAKAISGYVVFLRENSASIDGFGGFDAAMIEQAARLAEDLAARSRPEMKAAAKALFSLRPVTAREVHLLCQKIRHYAKYLFRSCPELYHQLTSSYLRKQRARLRRVERASNGR